eukprot:snap_masked-scaffold_4-processed-gene-6.26-mRNA-1 protein AED:1.00 eAED:1.00 QI:0/0/0/0/1/1/2/0/143
MKQISERLYEVATIMGQKMEIHSSRLMYFAPSDFLPNPGTKRPRGLKEDAGRILVKVEWRGFAKEEEWTWEPLNVIFEDLPKILMQYLVGEKSDLSGSALRYLRVVYPDSWKWDEVKMFKVEVCAMRVNRVEYNLDDQVVERG